MIDVSPDRPRTITPLRTTGASQTPMMLPTGDPARAHCMGEVACYHTDTVGGLRYLMLRDWASAPALFHQTAGGAVAEQPTVSFYAGTPLALAAELNPRQRDASLGPCNDTPIGPLCAPSGSPPWQALPCFWPLSARLWPSGHHRTALP